MAGSNGAGERLDELHCPTMDMAPEIFFSTMKNFWLLYCSIPPDLRFLKTSSLRRFLSSFFDRPQCQTACPEPPINGYVTFRQSRC